LLCDCRGKAKEKYSGLIRDWLANDRTFPQNAEPSAPISLDAYTVDALCADYLEFTQGYYVKNNEKTKEVECLKMVL